MAHLDVNFGGVDLADSGSAAADDHSKLEDLQSLARDPAHIDAFLEKIAAFATSENSAIASELLHSAMHNLCQQEEDDQFRNHCNFECHSDKFATFIMEDRETIVAANQLARERFDIRAATAVSDLDLVSLSGKSFAEAVAEAVAQQPEGNKSAPIVQAYSPSLKRRIDVAVLHLHVCALMGITKEIILICDAITPSTMDIFASKFGLTPAEVSIVQRFSAGQSIPEIAANRTRSVATVKTQFYKILEKCGAGSQGELLQMVARFESLNAATAAINEEFSHPHRRNFTIMRPGNRTLDVTSAGKPDGRILISCNSVLFRTFPPWLEEELYQNDIRLFSIAPPGSGETSPPRPGESLEACFAADIQGLLDNIGQEKAVLTGAGTSFPLSLRVAALIPDRIHSLFSASVVAPHNRVGDKMDRGRLPTIRRLSFGNPSDIDDTVAGAFFRIIPKLGIDGFLRLALSHDPAAQKAMLRPDHIASIKKAVDSSMAQGMELNSTLLHTSMAESWEAEIGNCPVPIYLAIGERDSSGPSNAVRDLAEAHPGRVHCTIIEGATAALPYTHPDAFFAELQKAMKGASRVAPLPA